MYEYSKLEKLITDNCQDELTILLNNFKKSKFNIDENMLTRLRNIKLFLGDPGIKKERVELFKNTILHGSDCLTLSIFVWYLFKFTYNINLIFCKPKSIFKKFHVSICYRNEMGEYKLFKISGRDYEFEFKLMEEKEVITQLNITKPIIHFVNTKIKKRY